MAPIAWADVVAVSSTLDAVTAAQQADLLTLVNGSFADVFDGEDGIRTRLARIYYAAHLASLPGAGAQRAAGPVTSESRGGLSRSYQAISAGSMGGSLALTQWGQRFSEMLNGSKARWPRVPGQSR